MIFPPASQKKEEIDFSIEDNILKITKYTSLSNINKMKSPVLSTNKGQKTNKCPICNEKLSTKRSLKQHNDSVHKEDKPHKCSICDYSCTRKGNLKTHIESVHENKKAHKC